MATPVDLNELLRNLQNTANTSSGGLDDLFMELSKQLMAARGTEAGARTALSSAMAAPTPQVNPIGEALVRSFGLASESLTGKTGAFQEAQGLVANRQAELNQRRQDSLRELENAYRQAAERADKLGDMGTSLKLRVKADKALKDQEALHSMQRTITEGAFSSANAETAAQAHIRGIQIQAGVDRERIAAETHIAASRVTGREYLPPELSAAVAPELEQLKQLSQARGDILSDQKMREGDRKARLADLDARSAAQEQSYQDKLRSYFQQPAGNSGEAAQTPLGAIYDRAIQAGATTFEQFRKLAYGNTASAMLRGYDLKRAVEGARVIFPTERKVNNMATEYRRLTTGPLWPTKLKQSPKNQARVNEIAAFFKQWGRQVATSEELLAPMDFSVPGIEVTTTRK